MNKIPNKEQNSSLKDLEETNILKLDFDKLSNIIFNKTKLIPVIVQEINTNEVLLLAYCNQEALTKSLTEKRATFYSTSRNELWIKGGTSGDFLEVVEVRVNCEQNSLLFLVKSITNQACHTNSIKQNNKRRTCYYRKINNTNELEYIRGLE